MASDDLKRDISCSICLSIYTDPVTLTCGHSFCRVCITTAWDNQREYCCPECRQRFRRQPELNRNLRLCNIAEHFLIAHPEQEKTGISCTYCLSSSIPATKTCLHCEASLCDNHLRVHSQSPDHVLTKPTTSFEKRKCKFHKKILEYYCTDDAVCICALCILEGGHRVHQVHSLQEASEPKKEKMRQTLDTLTSKKKKTDRKLLNLLELRRNMQEQGIDIRERATTLIKEIKEQLEAVEKQVLGEISRQEELVSDLIRKLEDQTLELSSRMDHIEELCNMADPYTVLQAQDSLYCEAEGGDNEPHSVGGLDVSLISDTLQAGLVDIVSSLNKLLHESKVSAMLQIAETSSDIFQDVYMASDVLLDVNTAATNVAISADLKALSWLEVNQSWPETPERFHDCQVLSVGCFSSGRHYWEVEVSRSGNSVVGMAYLSINRKGRQSLIGCNNKSWGLRRWWNQCLAVHDCKTIRLDHKPSSQRLRIYLDYEAGQLSFYEMGNPIKHLHTFTTTFTEPLYVACGIGRKTWVRL
ncbi:E3 ubiquitin-protein ligase TRIM39-like [Pelobates fuscus]|uniref:E3 ubiquitin-protein ligase TRIM39-like n=1 Tax=Pelobates fuscus TaxID=191477 RepID=UPI002FE4F6F6